MRNQPPYQHSFQAALETAYEGFVVDIDRTDGDKDSSGSYLVDHNGGPSLRNVTIQEALEHMNKEEFFRVDVTQPFGLGTQCAKTYVTRCLVGAWGTTYKYLGLRMFAHLWHNHDPQHAHNRKDVAALQTVGTLKEILTAQTRRHLRRLDQLRRDRGAPGTTGRAAFDICLINRMDPTAPNLKAFLPNSKEKCSVSWHADSSLEHHSTIAVYQTLIYHEDNGSDDSVQHNEPCSQDKAGWSVAMRVAHNSEGPQSKSRGSNIASTIITDTPSIAVSLPSGSTYYMLDDFNHHHQHAVLTNGHKSAGIRYSCTYRLLRDSHNVQYVLDRCRTTVANFHKKGSKTWRSEQLLLTDVESEWLRQFYIQGTKNRSLLWEAWGEPIQELLRYWSQLEIRTYQTISLLRLAAEGRCGYELHPNDGSVPSKTERKARVKRKKAEATVVDLLEREGHGASYVYESMADMLEERATMRELWIKREKDHVFHSMGVECRPMQCPFSFLAAIDAQQSGERAFSPMAGLPADLRTASKDLRRALYAYKSKDLKALPTSSPPLQRDTDDAHTKPPLWRGWSQFDFALEMQSPWAESLLEGRKIVETRSYVLPPSLIGKRIAILQSPPGVPGISSIGNEFSFSQPDAPKIVGWCRFSSIKTYETIEAFQIDEERHLVSRRDDSGWKGGQAEMYGWVVGETERLRKAHSFGKATRRMRSLFQLEGETRQSMAGKYKEAKSLSGIRKKKRRF
jgi:hypothetical protein